MNDKNFFKKNGEKSGEDITKKTIKKTNTDFPF